MKLTRCSREALFSMQMLIVKPLRDRARQRELDAGKRFRFGDFSVICEPTDYARELVDRVVEALILINDVHPMLFQRIRRELPQFYIRRGAGAEYWSRLGTCVLEASQVASGPPHEVALKIVHEAAHARISFASIPWRPEIFDRIEKRCIKEEIAFCHRLAKHGFSVGERIEWYQRRLEQPMYTREAMQSRRRVERIVRQNRNGVQKP